MARRITLAIGSILGAVALLSSPAPARAEGDAASEAAKKRAQDIKDKARMMDDEIGDPAAPKAGATDPTLRGAKLSIQFFDATTGNPIPGATVQLEGASVETDARGIASFPFPPVPDSADVVFYALFSKAGARANRGHALPEAQRGYVPSKVPLHFMAGTIWFNRFSISPLLEPGKMRIVVDWSDSPPDLDAHLIKAGQYHISFRNLKSWQDQAFLDHDAMTGFGPETITIEKVDPVGVYTYFVHDFTNRLAAGSAKLAKAKARVMVFNDRELMQSFRVPEGNGTVWTVFKVVNGAVQPVERIGDQAPGE